MGANDRLFDVRVYTGECEAFECKTINTDISGNVVTASWLAEKDESFYLYVAAADDGDEDVTDRFGILMVQEESGDKDTGSTSSTNSIGTLSVPALAGLLSLLSVSFLFA